MMLKFIVIFFSKRLFGLAIGLRGVSVFFLMLVVIGCNKQGDSLLGVKKTSEFGIISPPSEPREVCIEDIGLNFAVVNWLPPHSFGLTIAGHPTSLDRYEVQYAKSLTFESPVMLETQKTSLRIEGLERGITYFLRVRTLNANKNRNASKYVMLSCPKANRFTTNRIASEAFVLDPPQRVRVVYNNKDATRVDVIWGIPYNKGVDAEGKPFGIKKYRIEYSKKSNFSVLYGAVLVTSKPEVEINELDPKTKYFIRVRATNTSDKKSAYSPVTSFITKDLSSSPPEVVVTMLEAETSSSSIRVIWKRPQQTEDYGRLPTGLPAVLFGYFVELSSNKQFSDGIQFSINNRFAISHEFKGIFQGVYYIRVKVVNTAKKSSLARVIISVNVK